MSAQFQSLCSFAENFKPKTEILEGQSAQLFNASGVLPEEVVQLLARIQSLEHEQAQCATETTWSHFEKDMDLSHRPCRLQQDANQLSVRRHQITSSLGGDLSKVRQTSLLQTLEDLQIRFTQLEKTASRVNQQRKNDWNQTERTMASSQNELRALARELASENARLDEIEQCCPPISSPLFPALPPPPPGKLHLAASDPHSASASSPHPL